MDDRYPTAEHYAPSWVKSRPQRLTLARQRHTRVPYLCGRGEAYTDSSSPMEAYVRVSERFSPQRLQGAALSLHGERRLCLSRRHTKGSAGGKAL